MPLRKSRKAGKAARWKPRRRGEPDTPPTVAKSYTLPVSVFLAIRRVASVYGSQGRALQVGSEILSRLDDPIPQQQLVMLYGYFPPPRARFSSTAA